MADEATDVNQTAEVQEAAPPVPSTEENKAPEPKGEAVDPTLEALKDEPSKENPKESPPDKPEEPEDSAPVTPAEEPPKPPGKAEERKNQLNSEIRDLVAKRNGLREEVAKVNSEVYQAPTEAELIDEGMSPAEAKVEALEKRLELKEFNDQVAEAQLTLESESERVLRDFPMFDPESKDFNKQIAESARELLTANLITDPNTGQVIGSNVSPYTLYKTLAQTYQASSVEGQIKGQQATEKMLANADTPMGAAPPKPKEDTVTAILKSDD